MFKLKPIPSTLPLPIREEWDRLQQLQNDNYGLVFAVRDSYETVLKIILLSICYLLKEKDDDRFCRTLFEKQMAFGDWVNELPSTLKKSDLVMQNPVLHKYLKKLVAIYNKSGIVKWRNDFIGHGLMSNAEDQSFFDEAGQKLDLLADFLDKVPMPAEISQLDFDHLEPFMFREEGHFYLYESVSATGLIFYTDHADRKRIDKESDYFTEKRKKYTASLNVMRKDGLDKDIYLASEDEAIDGFYLTSFYKKPDYMKNWIDKILSENDRGIFLMKGGRGTGKSSFVLACDELNQHGDQKIGLKVEGEPVTVRAYYCNRIDVSGINDFVPYIQEMLKTTAEGEQFRSRQGSLPGDDAPLEKILAFYQEQYENTFGHEKLLLFIDGVDELTEKGQDILLELPDPGEMPENVYIVLTCRAEKEEVLPAVLDFTERYPFTDQVEFDLRGGNHSFLVEILKNRFDLTETEADRIAAALDDRLVALPLLEGQDKNEILKLADQAEAGVLLLTDLSKGYLDRLSLRYGKKYFQDAVRFLMTVSEATEGLTFAEISQLYAGKGPTIQELCFLRDLYPFLTEYRSYRGNVFVLSREEYRDSLQSAYHSVFSEMVRSWRMMLEVAQLDERLRADSLGQDVLLYICANLAVWRTERSGDKGFSIMEGAGKNILEKIYTLCQAVPMYDKIHREKRAFQGLFSVINTIVKMIELQKAEQKQGDLLLVCGASAIQKAVNLREMQAGKDIADGITQMIGKYPDLFPADTEERKINQAIFYGQAMVRFCEEYDEKKAEEFYGRSLACLEKLSEDDRCAEQSRQIRRALLHNYLGTKRNSEPQETLKLAKELENILEKEEPSFGTASDYVMISACYRSAGQEETAEEMLRKTCDMMEQILYRRKIGWQQLTDIHELELYFTAYWRLFQIIDDRMQTGIQNAMFWELKVAIRVMDEFISYMIGISQQGSSCFDMMRLNFMMTAALLRNSLTAKMTNIGLPGVRLRNHTWVSEAELKEESYKIVGILEESYRKLLKNRIAVNKIDAMFNLMNCACIYAGFGDSERGVEMLQKVISEFLPANGQEEQVYQILERKLTELQGKSRLEISNSSAQVK